jgi:hypothetical protein
MNEQQLEQLLEEAIHSVQDSIPGIVQNLNNNQNWSSVFRNVNLGNPSISSTMPPPVPHIGTDLSSNAVETIDLSETAASPVEEVANETPVPTQPPVSIPSFVNTGHRVQSDNDPLSRTDNDPLSRTDNDPLSRTDNDPLSRTDNDPLSRTQMYTFASEYHENMRLYQQNMSAIIRTLCPIRTRTVHRRPSSLPSTLPNALFQRPFPATHQLMFEFQGLRNDDVPAVPTLEQYTLATEPFVFNSETVSRVSSMTCPITLEDFQHGELLCEIRHCHHVFKETALRSWFVRNTHCPVCRYDIRTYNVA